MFHANTDSIAYERQDCLSRCVHRSLSRWAFYFTPSINAILFFFYAYYTILEDDPVLLNLHYPQNGKIL